ncbi:MAG: hypothetical protein QJR07_06990 [Acetobacteraceae bacterium]|nr:hypothetical protein [Acetobacteraceae bacterium]
MPEKLSPFQARVMDILGLSLGGIYNAPISWDAVRWGQASGRWAHMEVPLRHSHLATYDGNLLTLLVLAWHQARIRLGIEPHGPRGLLLHFSQRDSGKTYSDGQAPPCGGRVRGWRGRQPQDCCQAVCRPREARDRFCVTEAHDGRD